MKKNLFILVASASLLLLGGAAFTACDDDPDTPPDTNDDVGTKTILVQVLNDSDQGASAQLSITKDGELQTPVDVNGNYSYDVTDVSSGTVFTFKATQSGYIDSETSSVTLTYSDPTETFASTVILQITKKGDPVTLNPNQNNNFAIPSKKGGTVNVSIPSGSVDREVVLTPTSIPTAGSKGQIAADSPNGSFSLKTIDLESNWSGPFLNGQKATFTFPLTQGLIDATVKQGIPLLFGSNSSGSWESYPVTVNEANKTGTVSIPHFSRWYLTTEIFIDTSISQTDLETLGTGICESTLSVTFTKTNSPVPEFYQKVFDWSPTFPNVVQTNTEVGQTGKYWIIRGRCLQETVTVTGVSGVPSYTYFKGPVTFASTAIGCTHNGGGGS